MMSRKLLVGLMAALATSGRAWAEGKSNWTQAPTGADFQRYYPKIAADREIPGRAILDCDVNAAGGLEHCRVVEETPQGYGFGEAALGLSGLFRMNPGSVDLSDPARRRAVVPIIFGMAGKPLPEQGHVAGQNAWMMKIGVKKGSRGARPCPEEGKPDQVCSDHPIAWAKQPSLQETLPALEGVDMEAGRSVLLCEVDANGALKDCGATPEATPVARKAMLALAPLFVAPAKAADGDAVAGGMIVIPFDWSKITPLARNLKRP